MKHAVARLLRAPLFTLTASASLALAVGANTAIFSIANALWFRPLAVRDASTLVVPYYPVVHSQDGELLDGLSLPQADALRDLSLLESVTYQLNAVGRFGDWRPIIRSAADGAPFAATAVAADYFSVLGVDVVGRSFRSSDDTAGAAPVAVISERLARRLTKDPTFGASRTILTTKGPISVIGIAAGGFRGPRLGDQWDVWIAIGALGTFSDMAIDPGMRRFTPVTVLARLRNASDLQAAQIQVRAVLHRRATLRSLRDVAFPIRSEGGLRRQRDLVRTLWGAALLVLVLGAVNLAAVFLARSAERRHHSAVRLSLGSSRLALVGGVLAEVAVLSVLGLAAGLLLRSWLLGSVVSSLEIASGLPVDALDVSLDPVTVLFGAMVTLLSAAIAAGASALQTARTDLSLLLAASSPAGGRREGVMRQAFLSAHVALSIMLIASAIGLIATVRAALAVDQGFARDRTILVSVRPRLTQYSRAGDEARARADAYRAALTRLRQLPFVSAATYGDSPFDPNREPYEILLTVDGHERTVRQVHVRAGPAYLAASGVTLVEGRDLGDGDAEHVPTQLDIMQRRSPRFRNRPTGVPRFSNRSVALIDRSLASELWPGLSPLGREFSWSSQGLTYEVVGVVDRFGPLSDADRPRPTFLAPASIRTYDGTQTLDIVIGTRDNPRAHIEEVAAVLRELFPEAPRLEVRSAIDAVESTVAKERMGARVFSWYAATAAALGLLGIYGLLAFFIARGRRELGIRSALGAPVGTLIRLMAARVLAPVTFGVLVGILLSLGLDRVVGTRVAGLQSASAGVYAMASALFMGAALVVIGCGSRSIQTVNPAEILRAQ